MKSDIKAVLVLVAIVSVAVFATNERGEWTIGSFVFNLFVSGFITGFAYLIGSCFERHEARWIVFIIYIAVIGAYLDRAKELKSQPSHSMRVMRPEP